jgi:hypothetical protein
MFHCRTFIKSGSRLGFLKVTLTGVIGEDQHAGKRVER